MKNNMQNYIAAIALLLFTNIGGLFSQISGDYPYFESFMSESQPNDVIIPNPNSNAIKFKTKGAVLTPEPAADSQFGALILDKHQFDAHAGIFISFEYMIFGGSGGDGMSVFFFDASKMPSIGAIGAGIGYAPNRSFNGEGEIRPGEWVDFKTYRALMYWDHSL